MRICFVKKPMIYQLEKCANVHRDDLCKWWRFKQTWKVSWKTTADSSFCFFLHYRHHCEQFPSQTPPQSWHFHPSAAMWWFRPLPLFSASASFFLCRLWRAESVCSASVSIAQLMTLAMRSKPLLSAREWERNRENESQLIDHLWKNAKQTSSKTAHELNDEVKGWKFVDWLIVGWFEQLEWWKAALCIFFILYLQCQNVRKAIELHIASSTASLFLLAWKMILSLIYFMGRKEGKFNRVWWTSNLFWGFVKHNLFSFMFQKMIFCHLTQFCNGNHFVSNDEIGSLNNLCSFWWKIRCKLYKQRLIFLQLFVACPSDYQTHLLSILLTILLNNHVTVNSQKMNSRLLSNYNNYWH